MDVTFPYVILIVSFIGLVLFLKGFSYKQILLLVLGGGFLLMILQFLYISFGKEFSVNLFFVKWSFEVSNYIQNVENYFNKFGFRLGGMGLFALFFSLIIPAALEEFGKFFFFKKIASRLGVLKSVASCVFAIIYVAIGFAFFETGAYIYFLSTRSHADVMTITLVRIVISTLSHMLFSAIIGYYFWKALFMKYELIDNLEISKTTKLLKRLKHIPFIHIHSISRYYAIKYLVTGFSLSIFLHAIYNFFMSTGNEIFAIFTVLIGVALFVKIITVKKCNKNYLDLKNKIAYLQEMKALKEKMKKT